MLLSRKFQKGRYAVQMGVPYYTENYDTYDIVEKVKTM